MAAIIKISEWHGSASPSLTKKASCNLNAGTPRAFRRLPFKRPVVAKDSQSALGVPSALIRDS